MSDLVAAFKADTTCHVADDKILYDLEEGMQEYKGSDLSYSEFVDKLLLGDTTSESYAAWFIHFAYPRIVDMDKVVAHPDNIVTAEGSWKVNMAKAIVQYLAERETYTLLGFNDYYSGAMYYNFFENHGVEQEHHPKLVAAFNVHEDSWREFQGTDIYDDRLVGAGADLVFSNGMHFRARVDETFGDLMDKIT